MAINGLTIQFKFALLTICFYFFRYTFEDECSKRREPPTKKADAKEKREKRRRYKPEKPRRRNSERDDEEDDSDEPPIMPFWCHSRGEGVFEPIDPCDPPDLEYMEDALPFVLKNYQKVPLAPNACSSSSLDSSSSAADSQEAKKKQDDKEDDSNSKSKPNESNKTYSLQTAKIVMKHTNSQEYNNQNVLSRNGANFGHSIYIAPVLFYKSFTKLIYNDYLFLIFCSLVISNIVQMSIINFHLSNNSRSSIKYISGYHKLKRQSVTQIAVVKSL